MSNIGLLIVLKVRRRKKSQPENQERSYQSVKHLDFKKKQSFVYSFININYNYIYTYIISEYIYICSILNIVKGLREPQQFYLY